MRWLIMLEIAKLSEKGQLTLPIDVRKKLNLNSGDKVLFIETEDGKLVIDKADNISLKDITRKNT